MGQNTEYKTKQKDAIYNYLSEHKEKHLTIDEILEHFLTNGQKIGRTTIYRYLEKLVEKGEVRKYSIEEGISACYQLIAKGSCCSEHFHAKCTKFGTLYHVDCSSLLQIGEHLKEHHNFIIDHTKTVFYGICEKCH